MCCFEKADIRRVKIKFFVFVHSVSARRNLQEPVPVATVAVTMKLLHSAMLTRLVS